MIPGPQSLIAGDMQAGYFGTVPASELWYGDALSNATGVTFGVLQNFDTDWLKFSYKGKILFRPMKPIRHSVSWVQIDGAGCIFGTKIIEKDGLKYAVRLMKGALTDPSLYDAPDRGAKGSEWNRLMLPIHEHAATKTWAYPAYVEDDIADWGIGLTDADLSFGSGNGRYNWTQEERNNNSSYAVARGSGGVSDSETYAKSYSTSAAGWAPVLELVNAPPEITGTDESLGTKTDTFSYPYTLSDSDGAIANITEKLNGEIVNSYDNPTEFTRKFTLTKAQLEMLPYFQTHTIEIIATDDLGMSTTRTLTFTRGAELLPEDAPLLDVVESVADLVPFVQGGKNTIGDAITDVDNSLIVPTNPTFQQLATAIGQISTGKKKESGTVVSGATTLNFVSTFNHATTAERYIEVTGLDFTPSIVIFNRIGASNIGICVPNGAPYYSKMVSISAGFTGTNNGSAILKHYKADVAPAYLDNGFLLPVYIQDTYNWIAVE